MAVLEGDGVEKVGGSGGWGGAQTSTESICWSIKIPPEGVGFFQSVTPYIKEAFLPVK